MLSDSFQRLYCDAAVFEPFSIGHHVSFARVLPFQPDDPVTDDLRLLGAEAAHLADRNDLTRGEIIDAYARCGLMPAEEAARVKSVIDFYGVDFFDLMGLVYANAGRYICALRWYRECIRALETSGPVADLDREDVYASVGYCLYALGLFEEAVAWTKSCVGQILAADVNCEAFLDEQAQLVGGRLLAVERAAGRTRYTLSASDPAQAGQSTPRLKAALRALAPNHESYIDWIGADASLPPYLVADEMRDGDFESLFYPPKVRRDGSDLPRHRMNLLFAACAQADAFVEQGRDREARQLLSEAAALEPPAEIIREKLKSLNKATEPGDETRTSQLP
jgi:tetratricopeptide (TPR) repeat protein